MRFLLQLLVNGLAVYATAAVLPGVDVGSYWQAIIVALILGFLNALVRPILLILTIPITIFTLGLFVLVINAAMIMLADTLLDSFVVSNFWWALLFSIILSFVNSVLDKLVFEDKKR